MHAGFRYSLFLVAALCALAVVSCGKKEEAAPKEEIKAKQIEPMAVTGPAPESMKKRAQMQVEGESAEAGAAAAPEMKPKSELTDEEKAARKEERKKQRDGQTDARKEKKARKQADRDRKAQEAAEDAKKAMESLPPKPVGDYKNILLITIDTIRADRMTSYGAPRDTTPNIDAIAKEGMVFENAFAQRNSTWPSLATIMTSLYPIQHGVRSNGLKIGNEFLTLAEYLSQNGYLCAAVYANATAQNWEGFQFRYPCDHDPVDERATHSAVKWLEEYKDYKFFMWVHYLAPHADYEPPQEYRKWVDANYAGPVDGSKASVTNLTLKRFDVTDADVQQVLNLYDGELLYVDNEVKQIIDALKSHGLYDKTLVMISADHGEELNDHHGYFGHGASVYDGVLRVPLIVRLPGVVPAGKRDATLVQHLTIAPTICEAVGLPVPEPFVGKSLMPLFKGEEADYGPVFAEMKDEILTVRTADYKYIANPLSYKPRKLNEERRQSVGLPSARGNKRGGKDIEGDVEVDDASVDPALLEMQMKDEELYHVAEDRLEKLEIAQAKPDVVKEMKQKLTEFQEKYNWRFGHTVDERVQKEVDPELKQKLEAMGYVL
ncbi:MAG: sulfatase-like hydrolase/transferase [Candidatus Hydrogenedentes bacterium]|nr:sulfatase-like hydrolase/transferase [Candidatus Hydrogenedentota bacterium]